MLDLAALFKVNAAHGVVPVHGDVLAGDVGTLLGHLTVRHHWNGPGKEIFPHLVRVLMKQLVSVSQNVGPELGSGTELEKDVVERVSELLRPVCVVPARRGPGAELGASPESGCARTNNLE